MEIGSEVGVTLFQETIKYDRRVPIESYKSNFRPMDRREETSNKINMP